MSQGGHSEPLLLLALFVPEHSFMLKSCGWAEEEVIHPEEEVITLL